MKIIKKIRKDGKVIWINALTRLLHREGAPAIIWGRIPPIDSRVVFEGCTVRYKKGFQQYGSALPPRRAL
jgi:hypothetical protein